MQVANHCPKDRVYAWDSAASFADALDESAEALRPYFAQQQQQRERDLGQASRKRWRWFRPPSGMLSPSMAKVLAAKGYSPVLGDVFSNDVFVGGSLHGRAAGPNTVRYHVASSAERTRAGSIVIFHVPQVIGAPCCNRIKACQLDPLHTLPRI